MDAAGGGGRAMKNEDLDVVMGLVLLWAISFGLLAFSVGSIYSGLNPNWDIHQYVRICVGVWVLGIPVSGVLGSILTYEVNP